MPGKILLVNSPTREPSRPTGLEYVAEFVARSGYEPYLLDLALPGESYESVLRNLSHQPYDIIGLSIFNTQWDTGRDQVRFFLPEIRDLITAIRQVSTAPIVMGGYGFSLQPEETLRYLDADYGVAGCAIPAFRTLLDGIADGTAARGTIVKEGPGPYLDYGFKRDLVDPRRYDPDLEVMVSTKIGCFERCSHCPTVKRRFRLRKPARVAEEVAHLAAQGVDKISFMHDTFNVPVKHAADISRAISGLAVRWSAYFHPLRRLLPPELVDLMCRSGLSRADVGGRAIGSDEMLRAYGVQFGTDDLLYATRLFKERGVWTHWFLGFGMPGESRETIDQTFALIDKAGPDDVAILSRTRLYRTARLAAVAQAHGFINSQDLLLEPGYYPFDDGLRDYIWEQAKQRSNCSMCY